MGDNKNIEWLKEEVQKIWERLVALEGKADNIVSLNEYGSRVLSLEQTLTTAPATYIKDAENASRQTSTYYNRAKTKCDELDNKIDQINESISNLQRLLQDTQQIKVSLEEQQTKILEKLPVIESEYNNISQSLDSWREDTKTFETGYTESQEWLQKAKAVYDGLQKLDSDSNSLIKKINSLHTQAIEKRDEVQDAYDDIFGYDYNDDDTGEEKHENGLKAELEVSYDKIEKQLKDFDVSLVDFKKKKETEYNNFLQEKEKSYEEIKKKIESLLPNALTAGLSHAYAAKALKEEDERQNATKIFRLYISFIALASCIPLLVLSYLYGIMKMDVVDVLSLAPKLSLAILPLYIPLVWLAIVANKKINLSKRLIEEYSHKENLSKTYEGLAKQIDSLNDKGASCELRTRLLYNIVAVSAENPGKLISDYNRADNPIIEILDKSLDLSKAMDKYSKVPLINLVIQKLAKANEKKSQEMENSVKQGLENLDLDNNS